MPFQRIFWQKTAQKYANLKKNRNFATLFGVSISNAPTDRITDTNMQNEQHNTLILREKYPILSRCSSVSYSVLLQCNTSPAAHGQPRAGGAFRDNSSLYFYRYETNKARPRGASLFVCYI